MNLYLILILAILIGSYLLDLIVDTLNLKHMKTDLPEEFQGHYDPAKYEKSQEYLRENTRFGILTDTVTTSVTVAFILYGGFNWVDQLVRRADLGPILTGLIFFGMLVLAYQILHLPFSIYGTFVLEEKYGFNKTTPGTFVMDILKGWVLAALIGGIILAAVLWFFEKAGSWAWLYCWAAVTMIQLFLMLVAPVAILPLFNKFVPLEEGELRKAIQQYAEKERFKIKGVFKMDGSRRSTKSNAFFTGLGKFRRIVLYDTLIEGHSVQELVSILAHEMGHYKMKHIFKSLVVSVLTSGLMFSILSLFILERELHEAFQMEEPSLYAGLFFFGFLYSPMMMMLSIFGNVLSRKYEYEADAYAAKTTGDPASMIDALKKLSVENFSNLTPHPLKVFLSYSHPPVLDRIRAIRQVQL